MPTVAEYLKYAETAFAAYAKGLVMGEPGTNTDVLEDSAQMAPPEAASFDATWRVVAQSDYPVSFGFSAVLLVDRVTGKQVLAIRGTNDVLDLLTDVVDVALLGRVDRMPQYALLEQFYKSLVDSGKISATNPVTVTGHSLGGFLAQAFAVRHESEVAAAYTYNAPGFYGGGMQLEEFLGLVPTSMAKQSIYNVEAYDGISATAGLGLVMGQVQQVSVEGGSVDPLHYHGIATLTDALRIYKLYSELQPSLDMGDMGRLFQMSGGSDRRVERALDALRTVFVGSASNDQNRTPVGDRAAFYSNLQSLIAPSDDPSSYQKMKGHVSFADATERFAGLALKSDSSALAYRFALLELQPFAVITDADRSAVLYGQYAHRLSLYDAATGQGRLTARYLEDRSKMIAALQVRNAGNIAGWVPGSESAAFSDLDLGESVLVGSSSTRKHTIFGGSAGESLEGQGLADRLYGGDGNDFLNGKGGDDYLEGGDGLDTYTFGAFGGTDTILDTDGSGRLVFEGLEFTGTLHKVYGQNQAWKDNSGQLHFSLQSTSPQTQDLIITRYESATSDRVLSRVRVLNYKQGQLGLDFGGATINPVATVEGSSLLVFSTDPGADPYAAAPDAVYTAEGGNVEYVYSGTDDQWIYANTDGGQLIAAGGGGDYIDVARPYWGGVWAPVAGADEDFVSGGGGDDTIFTGYGSDQIDAGAGNDHIFSGAGSGAGMGLFGQVHDAADSFSSDVIDGGSGNDQIIAGMGADVLLGGEGDDGLNGMEGDDVLFGGVGADALSGDGGYAVTEDMLDAYIGLILGYASGGNDALIGGEGDDRLVGGVGADRLDGGEGADLLFGDTDSVSVPGQHNFAWIPGEFHGDDELDGGNGDDYLLGGGGRDLLLGGAGNDTIRGDHAGTGDSAIELAHHGSDFMDGGDGDDQLWGDDGDDILIGGAGLDTMRGGAGDDVYVIRRGDAQLTPITDPMSGEVTYTVERIQDGEGANVLRLPDSWMAQISVETTFFGEYLVTSGEDRFIVDGLRTGSMAFVEVGSERMAGEEFFARTFTGTFNETTTTFGATVLGGASNDVLTSTGGGATLRGGRGDDTLTGNGGGNAYIYTLGDGHDSIVETVMPASQGGSPSILRFGAGISAGDLALIAQQNALRLELQRKDGSITIQGFSATSAEAPIGIERFEFADGSVLSYSELISNGFRVIGSPAADHLQGTNLSDYIAGAFGDDVLEGRQGSDVYQVNFGGGADRIVDSGGIDELRFGGGIDPASVVFSRRGDDLLIRLGQSSSSVLIQGWYTDELRKIESVTFATGSAVTQADIDSAVAARTFIGTSGSETFEGTQYDDYMSGGDGDDTYILNDPFDQIVELAGEGVDTVRTASTYELGSNIENAELIGTVAADLFGSSGANILIGNGAANTIRGYGGADILMGGAGDDTYVLDTASASAGAEATVQEGADGGSDTVVLWSSSIRSYTLTANVENLIGVNAGLEGVTLIGNALDNRIQGSWVQDYLDGGSGADTLIGGDSDDTYVVNSIDDVVVEAPLGGYMGYGAYEGGAADKVFASVSYVMHANVELLELTGNLAINGTGNALDNELRGNAASNQLDGGLGSDQMIGGGGNDTYFVDNIDDTVVEVAGGGSDLVVSSVSFSLGAEVENLTLVGDLAANGTGNSLANTIRGNAAGNILDGGLGADTLIGGGGDDSYLVDVATDVVIENAGEGTDTVRTALTWALGANIENLTLTGTGRVNATGNELNNIIVGNAANNTLVGNAGDDFLDGGLGVDDMRGGTGNDVYVISETRDGVTELANEGTDQVQTAFAYTLGSNVENLLLTGSAAVNGTGNSLNNELLGNAGANVLTGGAGNDRLGGGAGNDTLVGGVGNDTYLLERGYGTDSVTENDTTSGNADQAVFGAAIGVDQLWMQRVGNNLEVSVIGTADRLVVTNWYQGSQYRLEQFKASDGKVLSESRVQALVDAMAAFAPPPIGQTSLSPQYQDALMPVIAANWQ